MVTKFSWRIGTDAVPTKDSLAKRLSFMDTLCPLHEDVTYSINIFFECPMAKAIWLGSSWGLWINHINVSCIIDIVKLVTDPSSLLNHLIHSPQTLRANPLCLLLSQKWRFGSCKI